MKTSSITVLAAAAGASAQTSSSYAGPSLAPSYTTIVTWEECSTTASTPVVTETSEVIITTCPAAGCQHTSAPTPTPIPTIHTTVYTTSYKTVCSTGLTQNVYTVTETCTGSTPVWPMSSSNYMPSGFTTTVTVCTACNGGQPSTVTMTVPCSTTPAPAPTGTALPTTGSPIPPVSPSGSASPAPGSSTSTPAPPVSRSSSVSVSPAPGGSLGTSGSSTPSSGAPGPATPNSGTPGSVTAQGSTTIGSRIGSMSEQDTTTTITVCPGPQCTHSTTPVPSGSMQPSQSGVDVVTTMVCPGGTHCSQPSNSPVATNSPVPAAAPMLGGFHRFAGVVGGVVVGALLL